MATVTITAPGAPPVNPVVVTGSGPAPATVTVTATVDSGMPAQATITATTTVVYGLVAANCLTFSSGTTVDMGPKYQVAVSSDQTAVFGTFDISKVTVHPKYDTTTQANNLAIVYFDASSKGKFTNAIADWPAEWKSYYFVRQTQTNATKPIWNSPLVAVTDVTADSGNCAKLSSLYSDNQTDLICTQHGFQRKLGAKFQFFMRNYHKHDNHEHDNHEHNHEHVDL
ncbi:hypothetical protein GGI19_002571 [Coemansia pectinata]|uniref:Uncharacterized protein n=1 Tax=Coemansia pectinata TaxID=1052879 RepID=A0A9W8GVI5_9FUNG|nr:hypothetical protein GGI19_002571 [Coemansia pectinata]